MKRLWQVPILVKQFEGPAVEAMNATLRIDILDREATETPLTIGTMNAAKIGQDLLRSKGSTAVEHFQGIIADAALEMTTYADGNVAGSLTDDFIAEAWAVVYRRGGNHRIHAHPGAVWSGVYYVSCPLDAVGGLLELIDPRPAALAARGDAPGTVSIKPAAGMLIAFPSWLQHNVTPLLNYDERICLAYNVGFAQAVTA